MRWLACRLVHHDAGVGHAEALALSARSLQIPHLLKIWHFENFDPMRAVSACNSMLKNRFHGSLKKHYLRDCNLVSFHISPWGI